MKDEEISKLHRVASPPGAAPIFLCRDGRGLVRQHGFQLIRIDLNRCVLVYQAEGQDKTQATVFSDQRALDALHDTRFDADSLTYNEFAVRFGWPAVKTGAQELNFGIFQRNEIPAIAYDMQHAGSLEDLDAFTAIDVNEQVGREKGQDGFDALTVLPNPDSFIGRKERFNVSQLEVSDRRFFVLGNSKNGIPSAL